MASISNSIEDIGSSPQPLEANARRGNDSSFHVPSTITLPIYTADKSLNKVGKSEDGRAGFL
jgi:hypothetical protein